MDNIEIIKEHIKASAEAKTAMLADDNLTAAIDAAARKCIEAYRTGHKTIFAGNGGSAADAQHLAAEFVGRFYYNRPPLPSLALHTNTSSVTAIGNDYGYDTVFARQIEAFGNEGDVFIGLSTSGNSGNLIKAAEVCRRKGVTLVALTGSRECKMDTWDIVAKAPSADTPRIQECHTTIGHIICHLVEEAIFPQYKPQK